MPELWQNDDELFALARRELFTAVVGDTMDTLQLYRQFLPPQIKPLRPDMVAIGRAMTVLEEDLPGAEAAASRDPRLAVPFGLMFDALDDLKPGELYVCTGASPRYALWGELMSLRALKCGATGAVLDGYSRDTPGILALNFPTFSFGGYAQDQGPRGRVVDFRVPIEIGSAAISPGDILFADIDGVCVVPRAAEEEVFVGALEKVRGEALVRKAIEGGMSAKAAFDEFGIM
jgi:regulator of RNase E activity RraA